MTCRCPQGDSKEPLKSPEKQALHGPSGTDSGTPADAGTLDALAAALLGLSAEDRARLAAMLLAPAAVDGLQARQVNAGG